MKKTHPREHSLFLKAFRAYLQFVNSGLYFKKEHVLGLENVPVNGTPTVIVSNHQNCLNDPLCVCLQLTDRRMNFLARANVFNNPIFNKVLRAISLHIVWVMRDLHTSVKILKPSKMQEMLLWMERQ